MSAKNDRHYRPRYRSNCPSPEPLDSRRTCGETDVGVTEETTLRETIIPHKTTKKIYTRDSRKHSRPLSSDGTPQEQARLCQDIQEVQEAPVPKAPPPRRPSHNLHSCLSDEGKGSSASVSASKQVQNEQGGQEKEEVEARSTTIKLPEMFSHPRVDRKRGRQDGAAGSCYAIYETATKEVAGDSRADMPYLASDKKIADWFNGLWNSIDTLSRDSFSYMIPDAQKQRWLRSIPSRLRPERSQDREFVHLMAQIAVGGPCGSASWKQILLEPELRRGIVCGIIWRKLRLVVFDKMLFGGTDLQERELLKLEEGMVDLDGFARTRARGLRIREMLDCSNPADHCITYFEQGNLAEHLDEACQTVTKQLQSLLRCITPSDNLSQVATALEEITHKASHLSRLLRLDTETIYYFPSIGKDSRFHPEDIEENLTYFSKEHKQWLWSPQNRADKTVAQASFGLTEDKVKQIHNHDPLVRIICSGAVETYRQGGWHTEDAHKGYRKRILFPARVILRWG
ncbi:hypothetical protein FKW77_000781 [Venturia effusa]|uniref:Uncharacterized protein n=1 Tax=Venturia effusa TaxID=50376 RepID=A0A517L4Q5_9PEZI|nr:hypothetical protein FKW77_000781 [Venturia effusa]